MGQAFGIIGLEVMGRNIVLNIERNGFPIAYRGDKFEQPAVAPSYYQARDWVVSTWWIKQ